jgi:hypothetical protein
MTAQRWYTAKWFISAGVFIGLILATTAVTAIFAGGSSRVVGSTETASVRPNVSWGSRCGLAHGSQDPVVGPPRAAWTLVEHVAVPSIPFVGPGVIDPNTGDRRCYAHSPLGALLAAANLLPVTARVGEPKANLDHFVPGRLRDIYGGQPSIPIDPKTIVTIAGFQDAVLNRDTVDINLALRINGVLGYVTLPMRWTMPNGDWRVQLLSTSAPFDAGRIDSLDGYIPWSA